MKPFCLARPAEPISVLCLGAHSDDIEIGVGGTLLDWIAAGRQVNVHWCVLSAGHPQRRSEATAGANEILKGACSQKIDCLEFRDGYFPQQGEALKDWFESLKDRVNPDIIFTHRRDDGHQDHREVSRLTWNSFRNHNIFEYEIPKWDGDICNPNTYIPLTAGAMRRKIDILTNVFGTQRSKDWFDADTFMGLARLRGVECRAPERFAEAFVARKIVVG
jgi:LmbE family N-acetylglucosaminyl deacetylase